MGRVIILPDVEDEYAFTPSGYDGVTIWYRRLTDEQVEEIDRRHRRVDYRHGRRDVFIPEEKLIDRARDFWDATIVRWEGINDPAGRPLACNAKTKEKLLLLMPELRDEFVRARAANIPQPENGDTPDPTRHSAGPSPGNGTSPTGPVASV